MTLNALTALSPLDGRYGAGIVNVFNAWHQLSGGQHSFIESTTNDSGGAHPPGTNRADLAALTGWDFATLTNSGGPVSDQERVNHYYFSLLKRHRPQIAVHPPEGLALTTDQAAGVVSLHIEELGTFDVVFLNDGFKAECLQELRQNFFRLSRHILIYLIRKLTGIIFHDISYYTWSWNFNLCNR